MIRRKKIEHDIESLIPLLVERLQKEKDVIFAYLFGSRARGEATALSDKLPQIKRKDKGGQIWYPITS